MGGRRRVAVIVIGLLAGVVPVAANGKPSTPRDCSPDVASAATTFTDPADDTIFALPSGATGRDPAVDLRRVTVSAVSDGRPGVTANDGLRVSFRTADLGSAPAVPGVGQRFRLSFRGLGVAHTAEATRSDGVSTYTFDGVPVRGSWDLRHDTVTVHVPAVVRRGGRLIFRLTPRDRFVELHASSHRALGPTGVEEDSAQSPCAVTVPSSFPHRPDAVLRFGGTSYKATGGPWMTPPDIFVGAVGVSGPPCDDVGVPTSGLEPASPCLEVSLDLRVTRPDLALVLNVRPDEGLDRGFIGVVSPQRPPDFETIFRRLFTGRATYRVPVTTSGVHTVLVRPEAATEGTVRIATRLSHLEPPPSAYDARLTSGGPRHQFAGGPFTGAERTCEAPGPGCDEWVLYLPEDGTLSVRLRPAADDYEGNDFDLIVEEALTGATHAASDADSDEWMKFPARAGVWYMRVMGYFAIDGSYQGAVRLV